MDLDLMFVPAAKRQGADSDDDDLLTEGSPKRQRRAAAKQVRAAVGPLEKKDMAKLLEIVSMLIRLGLQTSQQVRVLRSIVLQVMMMAVDHELIQKVKAAHKRYVNAAQKFKDAEKKQAALSVPHLHSWNAMLAYFKVAWADNAQLLAKLKEYTDGVAAQANNEPRKAMDIFAQHVRSIKLMNAFDKAKTKLEISIIAGTPAVEIWKSMKEWMISKKVAKEMMGTAPPGHMEDVLQQYLDAMKDE